jgi:hypothetical protein
MTRKTQKQNKLNRYSPIGTLGAMLESCRPAGSLAVEYFIEDWLTGLGGVTDPAGNVIVRVGDSSRVMWSSHTDTVHNKAGKQRVVISGDAFKLGHGSGSSCLGADCTTGVWLMREMILNGVNGLYVFHDSEETGGHGSAWLAKNHGGLLDGIDFCIAFDRKGFDSVITHQIGGRTASDSFVSSIAPMMPFSYRADQNGTFTDSAHYVDLIGECTNISVGYLAQHTASETQSVSHALALRESMLRFDESKLVASRKAGEVDSEYWEMSGYNYWGKDSGLVPIGKGSNGFYALTQFIERNPQDVAAFLDDMGVTVDDLCDFADSRDGFFKGRG